MSLHHKECSKLKIKQDWNFRGYTFGIFKDPPGQVWADYVHKTDELVILAEGEIIAVNICLPQRFLFCQY